MKTYRARSTCDELSDAREWEAQAGQPPGRNEMLNRIVDEMASLCDQSPSVLELGSGPGFLAERILQRLPDVRYSALDFSPAMHLLARHRLADFDGRVAYLERSFKSEAWPQDLPSFDIVVTNQAVHELRHKRYAEHLHRQVLGVLENGGTYLVSDHFSDEGGLPNTELFMTKAEQAKALSDAGFGSVERLLTCGSLALHLSRKS